VRQAGPREVAALGTRRRRMTKNHRTVRWCTGLSGESSAVNSSPREKQRGDVAIIHRTVRWCTGLSGGAPDCLVSQRSPAPTIDRAIFVRRVATPMVGRGYRTIQCAPDSVWCANGPRAATVICARFGRQSRTGPSTGPVRWHTGLSGAPLDRRQG
jgi:hypothetical protein